MSVLLMVTCVKPHISFRDPCMMYSVYQADNVQDYHHLSFFISVVELLLDLAGLLCLP